jgi:hypothetical protein
MYWFFKKFITQGKYKKKVRNIRRGTPSTLPFYQYQLEAKKLALTHLRHACIGKSAK